VLGTETREAGVRPASGDCAHLACGYRADIIVADSVILEIKSLEHTLPLHEAQMLTYLRLSHGRRRK